jgi:hypothetical protein
MALRQVQQGREAQRGRSKSEVRSSWRMARQTACRAVGLEAKAQNQVRTGIATTKDGGRIWFANLTLSRVKVRFCSIQNGRNPVE